MNYESVIKVGKAEHASAEEETDTVGEGLFRSRRNLVIAIGALALLVAIAAYFILSGGSAEDTGVDQSQLPSVTVIAPGESVVEGQITATGTVAARREMPVGVVGEGGRVIGIPVEAGDWVRQGQVLVTIDRSVQTQQAQSAAAQVRVSQADANLAQANLDRALQLVERGFVSTADVDRLTATRDAAVARVRVSEAQLRELQARNARLNIVAPAAGYVLERNVEMGQTVSAGSPPLFRIARGGEMEVLTRLSEADLARISTGVSAEVVPVGSDKSFTGTVWQISPVINTQDRQGTARVALPFAKALRPGGFASVTVKSGTVSAPILPESAVLSDDEGAYVFVIGEGDKVERRAITLGQVTSKGIIIQEGISGSERIVLRAGGFLNEGETVVPVEAE